MGLDEKSRNLKKIQMRYPEKFVSEEKIFSHIHRGDRIFIGTGCGEPQYLVRALINYVQSHPKAFFDAEVFHVWTLGVAPYTDEKFKANFRCSLCNQSGNARWTLVIAGQGSRLLEISLRSPSYCSPIDN